MIRRKLGDRKVINIIYITAIVIVLSLNFFSYNFSILLKLKPNIDKTEYTRIHFIDVGQGDAIAIELSNGKTMLVDSGIHQYQSKISNYLDNMVLENNTIDYLVLTHPDSDHIANMHYIVDKYKIGTFYRPPVFLPEENRNPSYSSDTYRTLLNTIRDLDIEVKLSDITCEISDDGISIKWLYPDISDLYGYTDTSVNNLSSVILIEDNGKKVLLTGDIDSTIETSLVNLYGDDILDVDVLKLAHHGSGSSTSSLFLESTSPNIAVASVGDNTYGHPANETINRILDYDKGHSTNLYNNFYNTKEDGNVIITLSDSLKVDLISNIDDYSFTNFYVYTIIATLFLVVFMLKPYCEYWLTLYKKYQYNKKSLQEKYNKK